MPRPLIEAFHARGIPVAQVYGATETGPVSIVLRPERGDAADRTAPAARRWACRCAWPPTARCCCRAPNLMRGYHREPGTGFDAEGWFHTGDLACRHDDGGIEIVGRSKELIISGGENIHPAEIETARGRTARDRRVRRRRPPDARWGEVPVLAVVLRPGQALDQAALQALFDARLARFKHPRAVQVVEALPKTALGKVQRAALARQLGAA